MNEAINGGAISGGDIRTLFAKNLKRFRKMVKISQLELAALTGLAHNFINDIENEKKFVSDDTIAKLANALKVEPYRFLLPEMMWSKQPEEISMDDFSDSLGIIVKEHCSNYFRGSLTRDADKNKTKGE